MGVTAGAERTPALRSARAMSLMARPSRAAALRWERATPGMPSRRVAAEDGDVASQGVHVEPAVEGETSQQRELVGGVQAFDVAARIGLRVAACLGFAQDVLEVAGLGGHRGEDVVRGAVDDAAQGAHAIGAEIPDERAQDRHAGSDGGLEAEAHAGRTGGGLELAAPAWRGAPCWR